MVGSFLEPPTKQKKKKKKNCPQRNLNPLNTFPSEKNVIITNKDTIERFNIEQPSFGEDPPKLSSHSHLTMTEYKKRGKGIHLPS